MYNSKLVKEKACQIRMQALKLISKGNGGHTGGSLSETDIMTVLFYGIMKYDSKNPIWPGRDRFILSKGHSVESYYSILCDLGFFSEKEMFTFSSFASKFIGHPNNKIPGIEMNSGSLGHGLSVGAGMALAAKLDDADYKVYVLMGDGEQAEGSVWEAAMAAAHYKLDNLIAIIDRNHLQITGRTDEVMSLEPLDKKWESFGFNVCNVNGHDYDELYKAFSAAPMIPGKPTLILAETVKGKGVSFMENRTEWHHKVPDTDQLSRAFEELEKEMVECK